MNNPSYGRVFNSFQELYNAGNNQSQQYWDDDPFDRSDEYEAPQPTAGQQMKAAMGNFGAGIRGVGQAAKTAVRHPVQTAKQVGQAYGRGLQAVGRAAKQVGQASGRGLRTVGRAAKQVGKAVNRGFDKFADATYDVVTDPFGRARQAERDLMEMSRAGMRSYDQGVQDERNSQERARQAWVKSMRKSGMLPPKQDESEDEFMNNLIFDLDNDVAQNKQ